MFDLNYQQSHRRLLGQLPRAECVCRIQTGDSTVTNGSALEEGCSCGTWPHSYSSFLNLLDMTPPTLPVGSNATDNISNTQHSHFECVVFAGPVGGGGWAVGRSQMG